LCWSDPDIADIANTQELEDYAVNLDLMGLLMGILPLDYHLTANENRV
jgi:hypothetical protein